MRRLWYRWQLRRWTRKTRQAKARWLATKETVQKNRNWDYAEGHYCECIIEMRYFEKLLANPELPEAKVVR
jgi:hypothetical protein